MGTSSRSDIGNAGKDIFLGGADEQLIDENLQGEIFRAPSVPARR